ncbi:MAG: tRNA (adenosine(37)-N6)-threonylcarbamoyltransferase complex transferase subunit TsaD [Verrucomicrobia bacterium]|nr:tRNA (adenosine(37)-N6)-threonylcarbamoyltransferase complex transferase subunit TsaD [Verrucomicrobiota bacterium]
MRLLALETSCDETSAAVIEDGCVLSNVVSSQIAVHAEYGGVVPELAAREHLRQLGRVIAEALARANCSAHSMNAMAVTRGPGLPSALSSGVRVALSAGLCLGVPVLGIHHHEAHLYSAWMGGEPSRSNLDAFRPHVSLIVSGGHTLLARCGGLFEHRILGGTLDDAAGECFDKVAKMMGLGYPGGPQIEAMARGGNSRAFDFPRPKRDDADDDFSFSGLKTAVKYFLRDRKGILDSSEGRADTCASVQEAIVEVLAVKLLRAAKRERVGLVTASGGVVCNGRLRETLMDQARESGIECRLAEKRYCTDNAAMVGILAMEKMKRGIGEFLSWEAEAAPGMALELEGRGLSAA